MYRTLAHNYDRKFFRQSRWERGTTFCSYTEIIFQTFFYQPRLVVSYSWWGRTYRNYRSFPFLTPRSSSQSWRDSFSCFFKPRRAMVRSGAGFISKRGATGIHYWGWWRSPYSSDVKGRMLVPGTILQKWEWDFANYAHTSGNTTFLFPLCFQEFTCLILGPTRNWARYKSHYNWPR